MLHLPIVSAGSAQTICAGDAITLSGSGAVSYNWNNGVTDMICFLTVSPIYRDSPVIFISVCEWFVHGYFICR